MSAETLRKAATLMRSRAQAASEGPWAWHEEHGRDHTDEGWSYVGVQSGGIDIAATAYPGDGDTDDPQADAEHIAAADPPFMLAVAHWLGVVADGIQGERRGDDPDRWRLHETAALAVARTYLGESA